MSGFRKIITKPGEVIDFETVRMVSVGDLTDDSDVAARRLEAGNEDLRVERRLKDVVRAAVPEQNRDLRRGDRLREVDRHARIVDPASASPRRRSRPRRRRARTVRRG